MAVHLGFSTKVQKMSIKDVPFGKIGGGALWMAEGVDVVCCGVPSCFLCQILAPGEDDASYYRYLYIFQCLSCKLPQVVRCQLHRENPFIQEVTEESKQGEEELVDDWNTESTPSDILKLLDKPIEPQVLPDISIEVLEEDQKLTAIVNSLYSLNLKNEMEIREFYESMEGGVESAGEEKMVDSNEEDEDDDDIGIEEMEMEGKEKRDVAFDTMRWFVSYNLKNPVIRYCKGGKLLWYSDKDRPEVNPSRCKCGLLKAFECQVLPGIIGLINDENVEFGGLYIFTCPASCNQGYSVFEQALYHPSL